MSKKYDANPDGYKKNLTWLRKNIKDRYYDKEDKDDDNLNLWDTILSLDHNGFGNYDFSNEIKKYVSFTNETLKRESDEEMDIDETRSKKFRMSHLLFSFSAKELTML